MARIDDADAAVYGTVGYQAPEVVRAELSPASDLYTVGRTLAVLALGIEAAQDGVATELPGDHPLLPATSRCTGSCSGPRTRTRGTGSVRRTRWPSSSTACGARCWPSTSSARSPDSRRSSPRRGARSPRAC